MTLNIPTRSREIGHQQHSTSNIVGITAHSIFSETQIDLLGRRMQLPVVLILLLIGAPTAVTFGSLIQAMQQSAELEGVETFLTAGYRVVAEYSDTACTILRYGQTLRLNSCIRHDDRMWVKLISNSTTVLSSLYTDSTCTQKWVTLPSTYTSTCTADSNLHLFSLSGIPPSSTPIVRCSYSAADAGVFFYAALDTCISDLHKIISINGEKYLLKIMHCYYFWKSS